MEEMNTQDVLRLLLSRRENYGVSQITRLQGRVYAVVMNEEHYNAVVLASSFQFYTLRYHIAQSRPTLVICYVHDTCLPVPTLSLRAGNLAQIHELPETISDIEAQRNRPFGSQVLLGMYLCGLRSGQRIVSELPPTTRKRYLQRVKMLGKRKRGKPVGIPVKKAERKP
jgi:hypothetical protein